MALFKYIMKRIGYAVLTVFVLVSLTFFMMRALPGDPFVGEKAISDDVLEALNEKYGLDKPVWQQYFKYIGQVAKGDLGVSTETNREVTTIIKESFPYSFELGIRALIVAIVFGVLLGIIAAKNRGKKWDTVSMIIAMIGVSVPSFIIGSLLQYSLGLGLYRLTNIRIFPTMGWTTYKHKILPTIALSLGSLATISRLMRTSMLDVLSSDYIKTAKAKGLSQHQIIRRHGIRNALMPIITVLGPMTAALLTGGFVVENIFSIPGMGKYFVMGIQTRDYAIIAGTTIFYGTFLVLANLIVDILYGVIDPRVKLTNGKE